MRIRRAEGSELSRLGEIDRTEMIDIEYICRLAPDGQSIEMVEERFDPPKLRPDWDEEGIRRRVAWWTREVDAGGVLFVAESEPNGRLAGITVLGPEKAEKCAEIVAIFVDRHHRGSGLGRRLIERLEDHARDHGIKALCVHSNENANAVGFYRSLGYRIVCLMDPIVAWLPGMETCIVLAKRLTP